MKGRGVSLLYDLGPRSASLLEEVMMERDLIHERMEREIDRRVEAILSQQYPGKEIWATRRALRLSRRELAEILLVNKTTIYRWEHDETSPSGSCAITLEAFMTSAKKRLLNAEKRNPK